MNTSSRESFHRSTHDYTECPSASTAQGKEQVGILASVDEEVLSIRSNDFDFLDTVNSKTIDTRNTPTCGVDGLMLAEFNVDLPMTPTLKVTTNSSYVLVSTARNGDTIGLGKVVEFLEKNTGLWGPKLKTHCHHAEQKTISYTNVNGGNSV